MDIGQLDAHILTALSDKSKSLLLVNRFQSSRERSYRRSLQALLSARNNEPNLNNVSPPAVSTPAPKTPLVRHAASAK